MTTTPTPASQQSPATCAHSWHDFGQTGGRNLSWCPRCDTIAWTGKEPEPSPARCDKDAARARFEAAWRKLYNMPDYAKFSSFVGGRYLAIAVDDAWTGYQLAAQESAPSSAEIATWRQRAEFVLGTGWQDCNCEAYMLAEIADLRAVLARRATAGTTAARSREADRARFPDPGFNRWLDEGISDAGHTVWDTIADTCSAWHAWNERGFFVGTTAAPIHQIYDLDSQAWLDVVQEDYDAEPDDNRRIVYLAGNAAPTELVQAALDVIGKTSGATPAAAPGDLSKQLRELAERTDGDTFIPVLPEFLAGVADELDRIASNAGAAARAAPLDAAKWISVEDQLPEDRQPVAFVVRSTASTWEYLHGRVLGGTYNAGWAGFSVPGLTIGASHWMPLPAAPSPVSPVSPVGGKEAN